MADEPGTTSTVEVPADTASGADWRANLSDAYEVKDGTGAVTAKLNLRTDATLARYKNADEAARALIEQHKTLSAGVVKFPGADAKPEEWVAFRREKLGAPKDLDGYKDVKAPETVSPDGVKAFVQNVALARGWHPQDVQDAINFLGEWTALERKTLLQEFDKGGEVLRSEWGLNYDRNATLAQRYPKEMAPKVGGDSEIGQEQMADFFTIVENSGLKNHPGYIRWMLYHAQNTSEDIFHPGAPDAAANDSAWDAKIRDVDARLQAAVNTPAYAAIKEERAALYRARYGDAEEVPTGPRR